MSLSMNNGNVEGKPRGNKKVYEKLELG